MQNLQTILEEVDETIDANIPWALSDGQFTDAGIALFVKELKSFIRQRITRAVEAQREAVMGEVKKEEHDTGYEGGWNAARTTVLEAFKKFTDTKV